MAEPQNRLCEATRACLRSLDASPGRRHNQILQQPFKAGLTLDE